MGIIMKIYTKESFTQYTTKQIENTTDAIAAVEVIKRVTRAFDNKVLNKRFYDACKAEFQQQGLTDTYTYKDYSLKLVTRKNDCYKVSEFGVSYIDYTYYIANVVTDDNNRIHADEFIKALNDNTMKMQIDINMMQNDLNNIDAYIKEYETIKQSIESFNLNKSYITRSFLEIMR